jgi:hypothetical protein
MEVLERSHEIDRALEEQDSDFPCRKRMISLQWLLRLLEMRREARGEQLEIFRETGLVLAGQASDSLFLRMTTL